MKTKIKKKKEKNIESISLFDFSEEKENEEKENQIEPHYTVTQITDIIKKKIESIGKVWLTGEISNLKYHTSGHIYLTLKDSQNQICGIIWRKIAKSLKIELKDGLEVLVYGEVTLYGPQSKYQINIETIKPQGKGLLLLKFENLKKKLATLGLFDKKNKKELPSFPRKICIITSPTGAAVKDIINVIIKRFPLVNIYIYPVRVQGDNAAEEIAEAIRFINKDEYFSKIIEVIIVGRGGGSLEDLWAFNEEIVAYSIFESKIPIISAVGHEIDTTIADLVADKRALTPTEAGEIVVPRLDQIYNELKKKKERLDLAIRRKIDYAYSLVERLNSHRGLNKPYEKIQHYKKHLVIISHRLNKFKDKISNYKKYLEILENKLNRNLENIIYKKKIKLENIKTKLLLQEPINRIKSNKEKIKNFHHRLNRAIGKRIELEEKRIKSLYSQLEALSPLSVLKRGYSIIYVYTGEKIVKNYTEVKEGEYIWIRLYNSWILSRVVRTGTKEKNNKNNPNKNYNKRNIQKNISSNYYNYNYNYNQVITKQNNNKYNK